MKKKFDITNLGYTIGHNGKNVYLYKLITDKEYLIYDFREMYSNTMAWVNVLLFSGDKFENHDLNDKTVKLIGKTILEQTRPEIMIDSDNVEKYFLTPSIERNNTDLDNNDYIKPIGIYSHEEVNEMLHIFDEFDIIHNGCGSISQEIIDFAIEENGYDLLGELLNYTVKIKTDGYHKNDGQMVEYKFELISPSKVKTKFNTEMCLVIGWNYWNELKINE